MTTRMFAFVRAINTGHRRLTNDQLLEPFRAAGLADVSAYQAAGNVTLRSQRDPGELASELSTQLGEAYGFAAPVFIRTAAELRTCIEQLPFTAEALARTQRRTQIAFMATAPSADAVEEASALVPDDDAVEFVGREWWWLPRAGVSDSTLPVHLIERILGPMTMRTLGTVERLLARFPD